MRITRFINKEGEYNLLNWEGRKQYTTYVHSLLSKVLDPFWQKCGNYIPHFIAPNVVSLISVVSMIGTCIALFWNPGHFAAGLTPFEAIVAVFSIFIFQLLDALDGIHARNTGCTSRCGDFVDHFLDSASNACMVLLMLAGIRANHGILLILTINVSIWASFMSNHEASHIREFVHGAFMSITEAQIAGMALLGFSAFTSTWFWEFKVVPGWNITIRHVVYTGLVLSVGGPMVFGKLYNVFSKVDPKQKTKAILNLIPMLLMTSLSLAVYYTGTQIAEMYEKQAFLWIVIGSRIVGDTVLARILEQFPSLFPYCLVPGVLLLLNNLFLVVNEALLLRIVLYVCTIDMLVFFFGVLEEMSSILNVPLWKCRRTVPKVVKKLVEADKPAVRRSPRARSRKTD